ncbi:hypothetical protein LJC73_06780, partial [Bacteroidales bacterium OttesenSCG-928-L14]|nr:hypothetical protein [Bacteroidales bacterium OttesenSCG-928-L14]
IDETCSATSAKETLTMGSTEIDKPIITSYPSNNVVCGNNGVVVLMLTNTYTGATYQWYKDNNAISGENDIILSVTELGTYYIEVRQTECYAVSTPISVTVDDDCDLDPAIIEAESETIVEGIGVGLFLTNPESYSPDAQYYWFYDVNELVANDEGYTYVTSIPGNYQLLVVSDGKAVWSNVLTLVESTCNVADPILSVLPATLNICSDNGSVYFAITNASVYVEPIFEWYKDNTRIIGVYTPYYAATEAGSYYVRIISKDNSNDCQDLSDVYEVTKSSDLTTIASPLISMSPSSSNLCIDGSVILYVTNRGAYTNATYQWYKNGLPIDGATNHVYQVTNTTQTEDYANYTVQVIVDGCGVMSGYGLTVNKQNSTAIKPEITSSGTKVCVGGGVLLRLTNAEDFGGSTLYYQWFLDGDLIGGATSSTYIATLGGRYSLQVVSGLCGAFSDPINLSGGSDRIETPLVATYPSGNRLCEGAMLLLSITNIYEYDNPVYQWYENNQPIIGQTASELEVTTAGRYRVQVTDGECTSLSANTQIGTSTDEIIIPTISAIPTSKTICGDDGAVVLSLSNPQTDYSSPVYQWYKDGLPIDGANETLCIVYDEGAYRIGVIDGNCSAISLAETITQVEGDIAIPLVSKTPNATVVCTPNGKIRFEITNPVAGATYIWYKDNTIVQNSTNQFFDATAEGKYFVQVVDGTCSAVSEFIELTEEESEIAPVDLVYLPQTQNVCANGVVVLIVNNVSAYTNPSYVWYKDNIVISGENDYMLSATEAGNYSVQVVDENSCSVISNSIAVTSGSGTISEVNLQVFPEDGRILNESPVEMTVLNDDDYTGATYYWYKATGGTNFFNATVYASGVDMHELHTAVTGDYRLLIVNEGCAVWSDIVEVRSEDCQNDVPNPVVNVISPTQGDDGYEICLPEGSVLLQVGNFAAYQNPSYQWYKDNSAISGATQATLEVTNIATLGAGSYRVRVTDQGCTVTTTAVNVVIGSGSMDNKPAITSSPASNNICGDNGAVMLVFTNPELFTGTTYQWYNNNYAVGSSFDIADNEGYVLIVNEAGNYRVGVVDNTCAAFSSIITVTKDNSTIVKPVLTKTPNTTEICQDGSIRMEITSDISSYSNPSYVWYKGSQIVQTGYTIYYASEAGSYYVHVIDGDCSTVSEKVDLTVSATEIDAPILTVLPETLDVCGTEGAVVLLVDTDYPTGTTYQWYKNNAPMTGETAKGISVNEAGLYHVEVISGDCLAVSESKEVETTGGESIQLPTVSKWPEKLAGTNPVTLTFTNADDYDNPSYYWFASDKVTILSSNTLTYDVATEGTYYLFVTSDGCGRWSDAIVVTSVSCEIDKPEFSILPAPEQEICGDNGSVLIQVSNHSTYTNPVYEWYNNNVVMTGVTASAVEITEAGVYQVKVTDGGADCYNFSDKVTIEKNDSEINKPLVARTPIAGNLCGSNGGIILTFTNPTDFTNPTYQWYKENYAIDGANALTLRVEAAGKYRIVVFEGDCMAMSVEENVTLESGSIVHPLISKTPNTNELCENGVIRLSISNINNFGNATYIWYK